MAYLKIILSSLIFTTQLSGICQLNNLSLDNSNKTQNSLSINIDSSLILIGLDNHIDLIIDSNKIELIGTHAFLNIADEKIITFKNNPTKESNLFIYNIDGELLDSFQVEGEITGISNSKDQNIFLSLIRKKGNDDFGILIKMDITNGKEEIIFSPRIAELTSVNQLLNNNIAVTGTEKNFILNQQGEIIKEIGAPARSFGKVSSDKKLFLILQEYSDGSYIDIYDMEGTFVNKIEFEHKKNPKEGTRICDFCITKTASFIDFDISPNKKLIIAKDQFNEVFLIDQNRKLIEIFENSSSWSFVSFINNQKFLYFDSTDNKIKTKTIKTSNN